MRVRARKFTFRLEMRKSQQVSRITRLMTLTLVVLRGPVKGPTFIGRLPEDCFKLLA